MDRRGFIGSILALSAAPAIVRADSLMRIVPRDMLFVSEHDWFEAELERAWSYSVEAPVWVHASPHAIASIREAIKWQK